jgi:NifU-like protein
MQPFSALAKDHFLNPRNVGDVTEPAVTERAGSLECGAAIKVSLQIDDTQKIVDARFRAAGCLYLVASASILTGQLKGKATGEAAAAHLHEKLVLEQLGEVPADRRHCVALAGEILIKAIQSYSDSIRDRWSGDEALICSCFCISESTIENAIRQQKLQTIAEVTKACRAGAGCRSCYSLIEDILASQRQALVD